MRNSLYRIGLCFAASAIAIAAPAAHAATLVYTGILSGLAESPPNASPGFGDVTVTYDDVGHTLRVESSFTNLVGTTTASHIHAATAVAGTGTAGVATTTPTFPGFPLGVTSGTYSSALFDLTMASSYNPAYVTANGGTTAAAEAALASALGAGKAYFNIHTTAAPGGEIRAFLTATAVPEPATWALMLLGFGACGGAMRRQRGVKACAR